MSESEQVVSGWKPIESAPKDGRWLLGWEADGEFMDAPGYIIMHFNNGAWERDGDEFSLYVEPTHWMPLPLPPQENE